MITLEYAMELRTGRGGMYDFEVPSVRNKNLIRAITEYPSRVHFEYEQPIS
jgi:hypothetical protein